jgi:hydroxyacylglutathione hydrolase
MYFKQFYLACLAHASYLIGSDGEAAVVDPQRDVDHYIDEARAHSLEIRYVIETHLHADFVSGHIELARRTGAEIVFGWRAEAAFPHRAVRDGDELRLGSVTLRALETPGHTPESICWLVIDSSISDEPVKVLTGDTLFIGDVGRPDLVGSKGYSAEQMAGLLYDSLHQKLLTLDDAVEVYPAHGAGSSCGRNISKETSSTIGEQKLTNYALQPMSKDDFVSLMTADLPAAPSYFPMDAELNRQGARPLGEIAIKAMAPTEVQQEIDRGAIVLDVRSSRDFGTGHLPEAINIGLGGQFASWAGSLLRPDQKVVIIAEGREEVDEAVMRLARVGLENVAGFLEGGVASWHEAELPLIELPQMPVDELEARRVGEKRMLQIVDVRRPEEFNSGHIADAANLPLAGLEARAASLDASRPTAVICAGGYRSSTAASILQRHGFREVYNIVGGMSAWQQAGFR